MGREKLILITNNIMTNEDMMVAIPVEEYEHLKECKKLLDLAFAERIKKANDEVSQMLAKGEVNMLSVFLQDNDLEHAIEIGGSGKYKVKFEVEKI